MSTQHAVAVGWLNYAIRDTTDYLARAQETAERLKEELAVANTNIADYTDRLQALEISRDLLKEGSDS